MTTRTLADYETTNFENSQYNDPRQNGIITKKTRNGSYNVIEKDYGDHKRIYHVPIEYGDDYDLSQLDEPPIVNDQPAASSRLVRRRIYHEYDNYNHDYDSGQEDFEDAPAVSTRRVYVSPRRNNRETEVVQRVYESVPPVKQVEYIYEDDQANFYEYRSRPTEIEYEVREPVPRVYTEETPRVVYVDESLPSQRSSRYVPSPPRPVPPTVRHYSPPPPPSIPVINNRFNSMSPPPSHRKPQPQRAIPVEPPKKFEPAPLRLMDVVAQNRARRGTHLPRPRREVDEAKIYDPPTYNRNVIKNGFIVHK